MPYKVEGLWVLVKRGNKWVRLRKHTSSTNAKAHAAALNINVAKKERKNSR